MTVRRTLILLVSVLLTLGLFPHLATAPASAAAHTKSGTWFETAFATWRGTDTGYRAFVRTQGAYDWRTDSRIEGWLDTWTEVDAALVRPVDPARNTWRADVPGLPRGEYDLQIRTADGTTAVHTFTGLQTRSFPRNGAAFVPSDQDVYGFPGGHAFAPDGAIGGYLPDGRVDPDAIVVHLTHENMATSLPSTVFSTGRGATANARTPLVIRVLGTVGSFETVAATKAAAGAEVPPGVNDNRMLAIGNGNGNVTVEGIGPDATLFGWGITTAGAHNTVFRNLHFDQWFDDALYLDGGGTGTRGSNHWVHNNTFGYGQNKHLALGQDPDQAKGDGAVDISNHARNYTIDYNDFAGSSKVMLIGGGAGSISAHYGTVHHNWFNGSEERTPRVRNGRIHVFNNLYENIQGHSYHNQLLERNTGYGIGAGHNATIWAEGNVFDHVNFPFLRSRQGHARGHQVIDYQPGPDESATANAGFNHFFGDAPGFTLTREVVTEGDFPSSLAGFRNETDYLAGLTEEGLAALRTDALTLQPNVLDEASRTYFDVSLDIGVVVAAGSTTTNPTMTTNPAAQLDWSFRPSRAGVWPTGTAAQATALRDEIETYAGTLPGLTPDETPAAPAVAGVTINDEVRSAINEQFIPAPGRIVVYADTFTLTWVDNDVTTTGYDLQWDQGSGGWETIASVAASARPTSFITQQMNQFALPESVTLLATAADRDARYAFRVRATNAAGASAWSETYVLNEHTVDLTALAAAIDHAEALNPDAYTTASWGHVLAALDEAHSTLQAAEDGAAGQAEVDAATAALTAAVGTLVPHPEWNAKAVFTNGDRVRYQDRVYVAQWWTQNQRPGDPSGPWAELGTLVPQAGDGVRAWTASWVYTGGETVAYNGHTWQAKWWARNQKPGDPYGPWKDLGEY